jgi:hypothetical protein
MFSGWLTASARHGSNRSVACITRRPTRVWIFFVFFGVNLAFGGPHYETAAGVFFFGSLASGAAAIGSTVFFSAAGTTGTNRYGDTPKLHGKRYGG